MILDLAQICGIFLKQACGCCLIEAKTKPASMQQWLLPGRAAGIYAWTAPNFLHSD
jgi:hypothetical protein